MKERPIIFSGPMVRAILEGRKAQTRRVVKPQRKNMVYDLSGAWVDPGGTIWGPGPYLKVPVRHVDDTFDDGIIDRVFCPYGPVGTRLWARETHYVERAGHDGETGFILYKASEPDMIVSRWRPSIHMPRWASRITLEVTDVRVERLLEINDGDAVAEGISVVSSHSPRASFLSLWDDINGRRGFPSTSNPWVWIVRFQVV